MSVVTKEVVTLVVVEDWSGGGAGGPLVSPANATELPKNSTHTNTKAFNDVNMGTSISVFS
jgi:hypothetical protein